MILSFVDGEIILNNVHHFDLKDQKRVVQKVAGTMSRARLNKTGRSVAFIGGDFNFVVKGEKPSGSGSMGPLSQP